MEHAERTGFVADDIVAGNTELEEFEFIEVVKLNLKDIPSLIEKGEIRDVSTIASYYLYKSTTSPS